MGGKKVYMIEKIQLCFEKRKVVSLYYDLNNMDAHLTGYIEGFSGEEILVAHISSHGLYDGYILKRIDEIYRIDYDGKYEKKIERLYTIKQQSHKKIPFNNDMKTILEDALHFAQNNNYIISLEFSDSYISGIIDSFNDRLISIRIVEDDGSESGISVIEFSDIDTISVDTDDEQDIKLLRMNRQRRSPEHTDV